MSWDHWDAAFEEVMVNGGELGNVGFVLAQHRAEVEANRKECQCPMCGQLVNNERTNERQPSDAKAGEQAIPALRLADLPAD
jgi:hypothetical protein